MRKNLPVTETEYVLRETETIVSKTDLKGRIVYVNQDFIRISGFTEAELIGAPHNLVRHPDMPEEAFADLWACLKAGKAWTGIVKNRCKNGDHYWVEANVAPVIENHQVTGYTSIRGKPSREQVLAADQAYRALKAGNAGLCIRNGRAVRDTRWHPLDALASMSISLKLSLSFGLIMLLALAAAVLAAAAERAGQGLTRWSFGLALVQLAVAAGCALALRASVVLPLRRAVGDIENMSAGDLSAKIEPRGDDEFARLMHALKILQINMKLMIGQINQSSASVSGGAGEIADGILDLSARTESQASSLQETAAAMEQLTSAVQKNADSAHEASALVQATSVLAARGGEAVSQVVSTMAAIREDSNRITDIIGVIDSIAFQTNILALNAAVEAARAGEQGRGFAVVASEVRALAQRSAGAAKEIKDLIGAAVREVEAGTEQVGRAGQTMNDIVAAVQRAATVMGEIALASGEQRLGIEHVNTAIGQMDEITQQNAALVEQAAGASASMRDQADHLSDLVCVFKLMSGSARGAAANRPLLLEA